MTSGALWRDQQIYALPESMPESMHESIFEFMPDQMSPMLPDFHKIYYVI
jgi:hypothetical protein